MSSGIPSFYSEWLVNGVRAHALLRRTEITRALVSLRVRLNGCLLGQSSKFAHGTLRNLPPTQPRTVYAYRNREDPQTIGSCSRGSGAGIPNGQALLPGFT